MAAEFAVTLSVGTDVDISSAGDIQVLMATLLLKLRLTLVVWCNLLLPLLHRRIGESSDDT